MQLGPALLGLTLLAWLVCESRQHFGVKMGPYDVVVQQVLLCEDQGTGKGKFNISLYLGPPNAARKRKRLHKGSFSWPFTKEETEKINIVADFYQKKSNDYLLMLKNEDDFCKTIELIGEEVLNSLKTVLGIDISGCELPRGNYTFNDWDFVFRIPTPMLEYGPYKAIVSFFDNNEMFGCLTALADVIPKK